jgi:hypothetical protein
MATRTTKKKSVKKTAAKKSGLVTHSAVIPVRFKARGKYKIVDGIG